MPAIHRDLTPPIIYEDPDTGTTLDRLREKQAQSDVVEKMMLARTPAEIQSARAVRDEWMKEHPDDLIVLDAGEFVENMAESLGLPGNKERLAIA